MGLLLDILTLYACCSRFMLASMFVLAGFGIWLVFALKL